MEHADPVAPVTGSVHRCGVLQVPMRFVTVDHFSASGVVRWYRAFRPGGGEDVDGCGRYRGKWGLNAIG